MFLILVMNQMHSCWSAEILKVPIISRHIHIHTIRLDMIRNQIQAKKNKID